MSNFRKIAFIGFTIGIVFFLIDWAYSVFINDGIMFNQNTLVKFGYYQLYSIVITSVNVYFFDYLNNIKWKKYKKYRLAIGVFGSITLTLLSIFLLRMFQGVAIEGRGFDAFYSYETQRTGYYSMILFITIASSAFFHAVYFYKELQKGKVTEQKIIAGTASAQFDALKNQLDPHFLFNSLNVLTSLIDENPEAAQNFTTSLSKVYRYVLEQKNKELVSVDEELNFARIYVRLLKMRFEDSIIFEIPEKASNPEAKVVPLSLQLLLENAVKHNIVNSSKPLKIRIYENEGNLVVENVLQPKEVIKKSSGVGLTNIMQRYNLLSDRKVAINKTASHFTVAIPMLTKQISVMTTQTQESYIEDKRYLKAKERVQAIKGFYSNVLSYVIVIPILAYINYRTTDFPWVIFPMLGWGFGILAHGMEAYGYSPFTGRRWEERKIRELMEKEESKKY
jgi:hypothetical protein